MPETDRPKLREREYSKFWWEKHNAQSIYFSENSMLKTNRFT